MGGAARARAEPIARTDMRDAILPGREERAARSSSVVDAANDVLEARSRRLALDADVIPADEAAADDGGGASQAAAA